MEENKTKEGKNNRIPKKKSKEQIDIVRNSYDILAENYFKQKNDYQVQLNIFKKFMSELPNGKILELGCASGFPVGDLLITNNYDYTGIDLSKEQINLAQKLYPTYKNKFIQAEMFDYVQKQESDSFDGILAFWSIFHLPRILHVELFTEIYRILKKGGLLFFNTPTYPDEEIDYHWFGSPMFWSNFSRQFYEILVKDLKFELLNLEKNTIFFNEEEEIMWYFLLKK